MSQTSYVVIPRIQCPRRSDRKIASFPIWLRNEDMGPVWEEETETQMVSRCGAGLRCRHLVSAESLVVIVRQDTGRRAKARVRYSRFNPDGKRELGIEFIANENFWGLDWNSSESVDSPPEQIRTPSGLAQMNEAIFVAAIEEAEKRQSKSELSTQLNPERRKNKHLHVQLAQEEAFVFTENDKPFGLPVRTLKEFISALTNSAPSVVEGHVERRDFSRWIADVFDDHFLPSEIRKLEQRYRRGHVRDARLSLARLIAEYCDFSDEP